MSTCPQQAEPRVSYGDKIVAWRRYLDSLPADRRPGYENDARAIIAFFAGMDAEAKRG